MGYTTERIEMTETRTITQTGFLLLRIAEDEAAILDHWDSDGKARVATVWTGGHPGYTTVASEALDDRWIADGHEVTDARHVHILFDPARVLAECEAKRQIVEFHSVDWHIGGDYCLGCDGRYLSDDCPELQVLAAIYADHPDYREAWRP